MDRLGSDAVVPYAWMQCDRFAVSYFEVHAWRSDFKRILADRNDKCKAESKLFPIERSFVPTPCYKLIRLFLKVLFALDFAGVRGVFGQGLHGMDRLVVAQPLLCLEAYGRSVC